MALIFHRKRCRNIPSKERLTSCMKLFEAERWPIHLIPSEILIVSGANTMHISVDFTIRKRIFHTKSNGFVCPLCHSECISKLKQVEIVQQILNCIHLSGSVSPFLNWTLTHGKPPPFSSIITLIGQKADLNCLNSNWLYRWIYVQCELLTRE